MHFKHLVLLASTAYAFSMPDASPLTNLLPRSGGGGGGGGSGTGTKKCPAVWNTISKELTQKFLQNRQCNPDARAAIRLVFHDCGAWNKAQGAKGGCDGSVILAPGELKRGENRGLEKIASDLKNLAAKHNVGVADLIVFAGNHAVVTCPGGPRVKTFIGRTDSTVPAPDGLLPDVNAPAADIWKLFKEKGLDERDLAALLGAHSTSNQFHFDTNPGKVGGPQDSTPGVWDVKYYAETYKPPKGVVVFPSDIKLANFERVGKEFKGFVGNQGKWTGKYADAMEKMVLFGSASTKNMFDCTDALPKSTNVKRDLKAMPLFAPRN